MLNYYRICILNVSFETKSLDVASFVAVSGDAEDKTKDHGTGI
jgi:hypothetical protein